MHRLGRVRTPLARLALACALILASGCSKESSSTPSGSSGSPGSSGGANAAGTGPILVGEFGSMTGSEANFGKSTHNGLMLAVEEQNAKGGIKGRKIEVRSYDDQGKAQEAGTAVTRLIDSDKVLAIIGEVASSLSIAGGDVAQRKGIPMISPSSTAPEVTQDRDMVFRVCFIDPFQGYVVAKFAADNLKAKKVAILFDQAQAYSVGLADQFKKHFKALGGTITTEQAFSGGDQDFSAQLNTIRGTNPDAIFIPGYYTEAANIALQVKKLGIKATLLGGDGWDSPQLAQIGKDAVEGAYYSNHYTHEDKSPAVQEFVTKYEAKYKTDEGTPLVPDGIAALGYDAGRILFDAMERAKALDGKDLAAAIAATKAFKGVTGTITIDKDRNATKSAVVVKMTGGVPRYAATIEPPKQ
jgi:branched-chain amino acid transport system substrate-binding protein